MYELFIANKNYSSWSLRPWVLMTALEIPFHETLVPFGSTDFRRFSPSGKVPCLVDGGVTVWDSMAITEYLAEQQPSVWPAERTARAWARCAAAEMHSGFNALRSKCSMNCGVRVRIDAWPEAVRQDWARIDTLWNEGLARFGGPFLAGAQFTAVDAFFAPVAFRAQTYAAPLSAVAQAYVDRLLALPAMQAWYRGALSEPWRETGHEADVLAAGVLLEDCRLASE